MLKNHLNQRVNNAQPVPELEFVRSYFSRYYSERRDYTVPSMEQREFGFMYFEGSFMERHRGFANEAELRDFLSKHVPSHVYYSSAYYEDPDADRMELKGWKGADLIFDLDADHVKGVEKLSYQEMLEKVKGSVIKLYDEFVCGDLGFSESETEITFSGGRGYHIHVFSQQVRMLGSHERREIVDYITANGLSAELLAGGHGAKGIFSSENEGWPLRLRTAASVFVEEIKGIDEREAVRMLRAAGISRQEAHEIYTKLKDDAIAAKLLEDGNVLAVVKSNSNATAFISLIENKARERFAGETDQPVTSDIHRLIRMPESLHGKTGFRVVRMSRSELDAFNPLNDALLPYDEHVEVRIQKELTPPPVAGFEGTLTEGVHELPLPLALFLLLRKQATLPS
jgi:DNA primase small subunit